MPQADAPFHDSKAVCVEFQELTTVYREAIGWGKLGPLLAEVRH